MLILQNHEIDKIKETGYLAENITITDALIENFYQEIMGEEEKRLLKLVFLPNPTQQDLDELLKVWDIEVKGADKSLLLSYFQKRHPHLAFTSYEAPRLKGLLQNYKFKNIKAISHLVKIARVLNENGITPLILKGGAMKHLRPDLPRVMGDVDILVPKRDFMKSIKLAVPLGYYYEKIDIHAVDLHCSKTRENTLDIHKFIYMDTKKAPRFVPDLLERATPQKVFGIEALVPCHEDMMFITLVNLARNLRNATSKAGILYAPFDCKFLLEDKKDFNWEIVKKNAEKTSTEVQVNFAIKFINKISEHVLPEEIKHHVLFEQETHAYSNKVMFRRFYMHDIRTKSRSMKIADVFKKPSLLKEYVTVKTKYRLLKWLSYHPKLIAWFIKDLKTKKYHL